jgi:two-component system, chemotaxis family, CheB/CheR fusion protein
MDLNTPDAFPPPPATDRLMVGIGASAGGIRALQQFFSAAPRDGRIAYIVILHLSPDHESHLAEVLQGVSSLPVKQVRERVRVEFDNVYVVPPNCRLTIANDHIEVSAVASPEERRAPIDLFLRNLAESQKSRAVSVILSGTGADGSMGMKRVKEWGGLCIAQEPGDAEYADMPRAAIATSMVDYVLPASQIPGRIVAYASRAITAPEAPNSDAQRDERLGEIFATLRQRTGHDFSSYKPATVLRRIERRMRVNDAATLTRYLALLRGDDAEARALLKDLLISVTNFFRDAEAFAVLEREVIPALLAGKGPEEQVRAWVAGCATGEEAYSIAMLLAEAIGDLIEGPSVQIFASDIDESALAQARAGIYSNSDAADVSAERLVRFFVKEGTGFRVRREIRDMVLFASHNLIKDPPFSHLDLVSCRNVLIYLSRPAQERVLQLLHFALNPGGYLFLGTSESVDDGANLFVAVDRDAHVFHSRGVMPALPIGETWRPTRLPPGTWEPPAERARVEQARARLSYQDLHQRLLEAYAPPSLLVNQDLDILHLSERAGEFLQFAGGEPSQNLLKVVRPELRPELHGAISMALQHGSRHEALSGPVNFGTRQGPVKIVVSPVTDHMDPARGLALVIFEVLELGASPAMPAAPRLGDEPLARQLEEELVRVKLQLRNTIEQYEVQQEELKASNEELQAMNEELRSSAEELETSKEELQSVNEELSTVNQELQMKVEELSQAHSDTRNLMNSTDIGTLFIDRSQRVKLFTARTRSIFNLIPADTGRALRDITHRLLYEGLAADIDHVLDNLGMLEREVESTDGSWYIMRILPYRMAEDRIGGVVLTFMDITERKRAEERLRESEEHVRLMVESVPDFAILTLDTEGIIRTWNIGARHTFGYTEEEAIGQPGAIIFIPEDRASGEPAKEMRQAREHGRAIDERWHVRKDGSRLFVSGVMAPLVRDGKLVGYTKVARDVTARQQMEQALREAREGLEGRVQDRTAELESANQRLRREMAERAESDEDRVRLLRRLVTAQEEERTRISRELHDQLGQEVTALSLKLAALRDAAAAHPGMRAEVEAAEKLVREIDEDVEFLVWQLRPTGLNELGFAEALNDYVANWAAHFDVKADVTSTVKRRLPEEIETVLYRVAQEALNNVAKHARASSVRVSLEMGGGFATMRVVDDGVGFEVDAPKDPRALGLVGMRERAAMVGGFVIFDSAPGTGSRVSVRIPL